MRVPWQTAKDEAFEALRDLIRLDTTNPPGNEIIAADYIAEALKRHGLDSTIRESAPTRANLVARIKGNDPTNPPILLSSHTDVVPVEPKGWTRPPFAAGDRRRMYLGPRHNRYEIEVRDGSARDDGAQARGHDPKSRRDSRRGRGRGSGLRAWARNSWSSGIRS